jgi:hypothetical protein
MCTRGKEKQESPKIGELFSFLAIYSSVGQQWQQWCPAMERSKRSTPVRFTVSDVVCLSYHFDQQEVYDT